MSPPKREHPKGKPRPWETRPPEPVPDHTPILFGYLHVQGDPPDALEFAAFKSFLDDLRLWFWEKSGGYTWYHWSGAVTSDWDCTHERQTELCGPITLQYETHGDYGWRATNYAGFHWRQTGEACMVVFDSRPWAGGWAGAHQGHAAHGWWAVDAWNHRPQPEEIAQSKWASLPWPGLSLGGYGTELGHAFGLTHDSGNTLMASHWNWPNCILSEQSIAELRASPYVGYGPRPETGDWRRWA